MYGRPNSLQSMAARAGRGDAAAALELQHELEHRIGPIVRRALRTGTPPSALVERIRAAAARVAHSGPSAPATDPTRFATQVAQSLCESVVRQVRVDAPAGHATKDTVRS